MSHEISSATSEILEDRCLDPARPVPFQEVLIPFVAHGRRSFAQKSGTAKTVLGSAAINALERQLLTHLSFIANLAIGREFYEFRFRSAPATVFEFLWDHKTPGRTIYAEFVRNMRHGGLDAFFGKYPVLARLCCQSVDQWTDAAVNLCGRFLDDFDELRNRFGWQLDSAIGAIAALRTDLSDRHNAGQTVIECFLRTQDRVVYKPRSVQPEIQFYKFVNWINSRKLSLDLKELCALDRGEYGWVQHAAFKSCQSKGEVRSFYARTGMLLCVLYALGSTDMHHQNVIANGEYPVTVDLETMLCSHHPLRGKGNQAAILNIGLLPRTVDSPSVPDLSGLGADTKQTEDAPVPQWHSINTDAMKLTFSKPLSISATHRPHLREVAQPPLEFLPALVAGFEEAYSCLLSNRQEILANERLLSGFDGLELRVLVRDSATYSAIHLRLLYPEFLMDGLDRSIELDWLARPLSARAKPQKARLELYERERAAMENLDVPHFGTSMWKKLEQLSSVRDTLLPNGRRDSTVLRERLAILSAEDRESQVAALTASIRSRFDPDYVPAREPVKEKLITIHAAAELTH